MKVKKFIVPPAIAPKVFTVLEASFFFTGGGVETAVVVAAMLSVDLYTLCTSGNTYWRQQTTKTTAKKQCGAVQTKRNKSSQHTY